MSVEKLWDEPWIGVKCQSNAEIAGTPRNSFRASLRKIIDGRALIWQGGVKLPTLVKLRMAIIKTLGVRLRVIRPVVKRETAQTAD